MLTVFVHFLSNVNASITMYLPTFCSVRITNCLVYLCIIPSTERPTVSTSIVIFLHYQPALLLQQTRMEYSKAMLFSWLRQAVSDVESFSLGHASARRCAQAWWSAMERQRLRQSLDERDFLLSSWFITHASVVFISRRSFDVPASLVPVQTNTSPLSAWLFTVFSICCCMSYRLFRQTKLIH